MLNIKKIVRWLGPDVKLLSGPVLILIIVILLSVFVAKNGIARIQKQMEEYDKVSATEQTLENKLSILKEAESGVLNQTDSVLIALPEQNPAMLVISNIRTSAREKEILFEDLAVSRNEEKDDLKNMGIELSTRSDDFFVMVTFLKEMVNSAPLSAVQEVKIERRPGSDVYLGEIGFGMYWSALPTTLPQLTEPIEALTTDEQSVVSRISSLKKPVFSSLDATSPKERLIPFN